MKTTTYLLLILAAALQACENAPVRREALLAEHPQWNGEVKQLIQAGYLAKGMDQDQVSASWGKPCWSCTGTTTGDWGESWEYATQTVFFDKSGKVSHWETN
jgi:hypothetical protein